MKPQYDLAAVTDLADSLLDLKGFWKLWSSCLLASCGLQVPRGYIVSRPPVDRAGLLGGLGSTTALIRHDKRLESPPHPRGGFLVGEDMLQETVQFFFDLDRIVAVYEPADPLLNLYNMSVLFESDREATVEVVGPGFDASDLQRGDLSPHEAFSVRISPGGTVSDLKLVSRVDQAAYQESVAQRKDKIRKKLESAPSPDLARRIRENLGFPDDLEAHLRQIGSPLCEFQNYQPISQDLIQDTISKIFSLGVIERYLTLTGADFPLVFSSSLVNRGEKQVFWDIVSPKLKFEGLAGVSKSRE